MKLFPQGVAITVGKNLHDSTVTDIETGEPIQYVSSLDCHVSLDRPPEIRLSVCAASLQFSGPATWILDEETLRQIAHANGFNLVAIG